MLTLDILRDLGHVHEMAGCRQAGGDCQVRAQPGLEATSVNADDLDALFSRFEQDVFRLEALQCYAVSQEDEDFRAYREHRPRPVRSVRTSPWLARIAVTTAAGKSWRRVHVVDHPLSEYVRYELTGYVVSQAAGEDVRITDRAADPALMSLTGDFWLFDADTPHAHAVLMRYDSAGHWLGGEDVSDPGTLARCRAQRDLALRHSVTLNAYLAGVRTPEQRVT